MKIKLLNTTTTGKTKKEKEEKAKEIKRINIKRHGIKCLEGILEKEIK